jgi:RHS repeat-associated protein
VLEETDLNGGLKNEYVFFGGKRIARIGPPLSCPPPPPGQSSSCPPNVQYYFGDHLGSTDVVTDTVGNIKEESDFYPFGGERIVTDSGIDNRYKFTGKERDPETGCDYFGARYYCNPIGRFITPDWADKPVTVPYAHLGNPQSLNLYSYVQNNPTTLGDPDGHDGFLDSLKKYFYSLIQPIMNLRSDSGDPLEETHRSQMESEGRPPMMIDAHEITAKTTEGMSQGLEVMSNVIGLMDVSGMGGVGRSMMEGDTKGAIIGMAFIALPSGEHINMSEAKSLVGGWAKGTFETLASSLRYHNAEHGAEVGAKNVWQYMRKAEGFKQNLKGATKSAVPGGTPGVTRYVKKENILIWMQMGR